MGVAVEEEKNPAEEEDKNLVGDEDKNPAEKEDKNQAGQGQVLLSKAEKTHLSVDAEEPHLPSRNEPAPDATAHWDTYVSVPEDVRLPDACHLNPNRVPVPPPPRGPARLQEIHRRRVDLPPELLADPLYGMNSPEWDRIFKTEHEIRLHSFAASPPASWFDSDDELLFDDDDNPDAAKTDADLYVRQPGEDGYVSLPSDMPMAEGKPVVDNEA